MMIHSLPLSPFLPPPPQDPGSGRSPLHWAVESQSPRVVQLLLQRGANVDQPSYAGHTALYCSLHRPNKEVQALLKAGGASDAQAQDEEERESEEVRVVWGS